MTTPAPIEPAHGRYRPDIDGLRALAILPVVFYHFGVPGFGGGFIGVDIFFVISGYLITQVLTDAERPMSLATFYARRVRRLMPALAVMVVAVVVAALILMPPRSLMEFAESLISLAGGGSNFYFWKSLAGYFAAADASRPILHTWSLAVEEQFYLLFPIFLLLTGRLGARLRFAAVIVAGVASCLLAAWLAPRAPSASFYLPPTRAWELLAGAALALRPVTGGAKASAFTVIEGVIGLALVAFAVVTLGPDSQVPGVAALIPCLGAVLLIHAGEIAPSNPASRLISASPLVWIGLISYALYLWHWPIYVFAQHFMSASTNVWAATAQIACAFGLAYLSWRFIERPLRRGPLLGTTARAFAAVAAVSIAFAAVGVGIIVADGLPERFPGLAALAPAPGEQATDRRIFKIIGPRSPAQGPGVNQSGWLFRKSAPNPRRVMIWGDSFAAHLAPGFRQLEGLAPFSVYQHTKGACPPVIDYDPLSDRACHPHNLKALDAIRAQSIDTVILSAYWQSYTQSGKLPIARIVDTVEHLRRMGLSVVVVGQSPVYGFEFPDEYHYRQVKSGASRDEGWAAAVVDPTLNPALRAAIGTGFFDPTPVFCRANLCSYRTSDRYLVRDVGHLTTLGSTRLVGALLQTPQLRGDGVTAHKSP